MAGRKRTRTVIPPKDLAKTYREKIEDRMRRYRRDSPHTVKAFFKIGGMLEEEMKRTIIKKKIIDTGNLINKTTFEIYETPKVIGVMFGTFGVPYAKFQEFGARASIRNIRAMMFAKRKAGEHKRPYDKNDRPVIDLARGIFRKRPYIAPSIRKKRHRVLQILRDLYSFK